MIKHINLSFGFLLPAIILFVWNAGFTKPENGMQNGGSILGIVVPCSVKTNILVVSVSDTIAHTYSDTTNGAYILKDIPPGNYALVFVPTDHRYRKNSLRAAVSEGQITIADTVRLLR
jgi:hypothetical protein